MSIAIAYRDGVFEPLDGVGGATPGDARVAQSRRNELRLLGPPGRCRLRHAIGMNPGSLAPGGYTDWVMPRSSPVVHSDPDILGGTPVFVGTRVPVQSLFDYLEAGDTLDEFLRQFPSVRREQAIEALEFARETLLTSARPA